MRKGKHILHLGQRLVAALVIVAMLMALVQNISLHAGGTTPSAWESGSGVTQIVMGSGQTIALLDDGSLWAWGGYPESMPTLVCDYYDWAFVAERYRRVAAIQSDGSLWEWPPFASNVAHAGPPTRVGSEHDVWDWTGSDNWTSVPQGHWITQTVGWGGVSHGHRANGSASVMTTSGRTYRRIEEDGTLWTWGCNRYGQLGDGTYVSHRNTPVQVYVGYNYQWGGHEQWRSVSGDAFTVALTYSGTIWAWGWANEYDEFMNPIGINNVPVRIDPTDYRNPQQGWGGWVSVEAHGNMAIAIREDGTVWHFGLVQERELIDVNYNLFSIPTTRMGEPWYVGSINQGWHQPSQFSSPQVMAIRGDFYRHPFVHEGVFIRAACGSIFAYGYTGSINASTGSWGEYLSLTLVRGAPQAPTLRTAQDTRVSASPGARVRVPIVLQHNPGIASFNFTISYDPTLLSPMDMTNEYGHILSTLGGSVFVTNIDRDAGTITAVWASPNDVTREELFEIEFEVQNNIDINSTGRIRTPLRFTVEEMRRADHTPVNPGIQNGRIIMDTASLAGVIIGTASARPTETVRVPVTWRDWNPGHVALTLMYDRDIISSISAIHPGGQAVNYNHVTVWCQDAQEHMSAISIDWWGGASHPNDASFYIEVEIANIPINSGERIVTPLTAHTVHSQNANRTHARNGFVAVITDDLLWGDVNLDGNVDIMDLVLIAQHVSGLPNMQLTGISLIAADVFFDGAINTSDLIHMAQYLASPDMNNPDVILGPGSTGSQNGV